MNVRTGITAAQPAPPADLRYRAFLSYSHRDREWADWLHQAIENYRVPKALVGRSTSAGEVPARLAPVFRDREELAASEDLGATIREALGQSRCLIVLCSPAAATSRWTNEEIATFKRLRPDGRVLAAIVEGEPYASEMAGREAEECFPPALRYRIDGAGNVTSERAEPIAADFRESGDGKHMGSLKLIAGMLGVDLDSLARREAQRRHKRMTYVAAASLAGMAVTSGLAIAAVNARDEARDQREEAEGLVGFMLGDLRGKLEPLGRLDVLDSVGTKALQYYQKQDKGSLTDESLMQRAKALTLIGEIANLRGDLDGALVRYREALEGTAEALEREPDNEQRIFDHAQNVFWVGYIAWQRGQTASAESAFNQYRQLAQRLVALNPGKPEWLLERVYADTNLGTLLLDQRRYPAAGDAFESALADAERLVAAAPRNRQHQDILSEALAYLADARRGEGRLEDAIRSRERQLEVLGRMAAANGSDAEVKKKRMNAQRALGHLFVWRGNLQTGEAKFRDAGAIAGELRQIEPDNTEWLRSAAGTQADLAQLLITTGRAGDAEYFVRASCEITRQLVKRDSSVLEWRFDAMGECLRLRAEAAAARGHREEALAAARQAIALAAQDRRAVVNAPAWSRPIRLLAGDQHAALGDLAAARREWSAALASLRAGNHSPLDAGARFILLARLGRDPEAAAIAKRLDAIGFRHPHYLETRRRVTGI